MTPARTLARVLVAAGVAVLVTAGPGGPVAAHAVEDGAGGDVLDVRAGLDGGGAVAGEWVPLEVVVTADRLLVADLEVGLRQGAGRMVQRRGVEVPAGSRQLFRFLVPPSHGGLVVRLAPQDGDPLEVAVRTRDRHPVLFGLLGGDPDAVGGTTVTTHLAQRGDVVALDPAWVDRSPRALDTLAAVIAPVPALDTLTEQARRNLDVAVAAGLDLVVTVDVPGPIDLGPLLPSAPARSADPASVTGPDGNDREVLGLVAAPGAWTLDASDVGAAGGSAVLAATAKAGRGRVAVTGVALDAAPLDGVWAQLLGPGDPPGMGLGGDPLRPVYTATEVLSSEGLDAPSLPWLTAFLIAFVVLVGPVNGLVLTRLGRQELAWATVPAITVLFAAGAFAGAARSQPPVGLTGQAAWWIDGAGSEIVATSVRAPTPGEHTVTLPGGDWDVITGDTRRPSVVTDGGAGTEVDLDLAALQVGTVVGWRTTAAPAPLEVEATATGDGVEVRITNTSSAEIRDVTARAATAQRRLGRLAPGETSTTTVSQGGHLPVVQPWDDGLDRLRDPDGRPRAPAALESLLRFGPMTGDPGLVWATGTLASGSTAARADGQPTQDLGSLVAVAVSPEVGGDTVSPFAVQRDLIPYGSTQRIHQAGPLAVEGPADLALRFRLPATGRLDRLVSTLDRGLSIERGEPFEPPIPIPDVPPCPPDATSCEFTGDGWEFCFPDGSCQGGSVAVPVPVPMPRPALPDLEFHVRVAGSDDDWVPAGEAFAGAGGDPSRLVSPLGEVVVRVVRGSSLFEYSGRGIGATLAEVAR